MKNLVISTLIGSALCGPPEELVKNMPRMNGGNDFDFNMWSGYINIPGTTKELHYLLTES